jgi:hypothetical protein
MSYLNSGFWQFFDVIYVILFKYKNITPTVNSDMCEKQIIVLCNIRHAPPLLSFLSDYLFPVYQRFLLYCNYVCSQFMNISFDTMTLHTIRVWISLHHRCKQNLCFYSYLPTLFTEPCLILASVSLNDSIVFRKLALHFLSLMLNRSLRFDISYLRKSYIVES